DFGDMTHSPLVCDLAVTLAAVLRGGENTFETAESVLRGYGTVTLLEDAEVDVLADAVAARLAATVLISAWRVGRFGENADYITAYDAGSWAMLELFDELGANAVRERFLHAAAPALAWRSSEARSPSGRSTSELLEKRNRLLGAAHYPLSYDRPLHLVRAEGVWMFGADGQRYLDAYNNVPVVGHGHPRVVEAVTRQARLLNTNTRYLHEAAVELAERLTETMPDELDTCVFVNSGSEANDLAWRVATAVTGRSGGIVAAHAYHGVTAVLTDLSPSEWLSDERPEHVETVPPPDVYRGAYRRDEDGWAERYAASIDDAVNRLSDRGRELAAMFLDPAWTSAGIFTDAGGYLPEALRRVHTAGGLFLSDEVQAGFGRLGSGFWSFAPSGIVPDFVVLGKPMGNGHPVGALVMKSTLSAEFSKRQAPFFSTFGGNPVACAAALAVLDVIEDEGLVDRAAEVGRYLRGGLDELAGRQELVGDVRGEGLLVGVELVRDRETREPASETARAVANGMRDRGILIGTTGTNGNVLKIRPPLPFGRDHADHLIQTLEEVVAEAARSGAPTA
ncbi:MAG: aminotransferase class III-fold pyridoxal phosphate-dependent enzyme, partial [Actinomycetota bacterium]|nr:aminotransferase class III-fold pyridoxal phosphate-dependent enzyme [Actinomycetota bacterium]